MGCLEMSKGTEKEVPWNDKGGRKRGCFIKLVETWHLEMNKEIEKESLERRKYGK